MRSLDQLLPKRWAGLLPWLPVLWVLLVTGLAFFYRLGSIGLIDETEPLFAEAARQMTVTGDWITPYFNGVTRFDKPPLIYWLMAIAYQTIGVNEWAARLPSALAGLALTGFCFYALEQIRQLQGQGDRKQELPLSLWVPYVASAMVALNPYTLFFGRTGYSDMLLSACFGSSLLAFFLGYSQSERPIAQKRWYLACFILSALAVLTKGPVGVVLPGGIVLAFLLYIGQLRAVLRELPWRWGILAFLAICVPWYILVTLRNGEAYINSFFGYHNVERFTSVVNAHSGPWYFHILVLCLGFIPWSAYLPAAIGQIGLHHRRGWQHQPRSQQLGVFALVWFLVVLGFFTLAATKYFSYSLPSVPAAAILVALWWGQLWQGGKSKLFLPFMFSLLGNLVICLVLAFCLFYSPNWLGNDPSMPNLGIGLQQVGVPFLGGIVWFGTALALITVFLSRRPTWAWSMNLVGFAAFLLLVLLPALGVVDGERQQPLRQIAETIAQKRQPEEAVVMLTNSFEKPSLVFYTHQRITFLLQPKKFQAYLQEHQGANLSSLLVIATPGALEEAGVEPGQYQPIQQAGHYSLVRLTTGAVR